MAPPQSEDSPGENGGDFGRSLFGCHAFGIVDVVHDISSAFRAVGGIAEFTWRVVPRRYWLHTQDEVKVFSLGGD